MVGVPSSSPLVSVSVHLFISNRVVCLTTIQLPVFFVVAGPNLYLLLLVLSIGGAVALFWYLRTAYIKSVSDVRYTAVATNAAGGGGSGSGSGTGSDMPCCGDDGCCTRSLFTRCYVWSGAPAAPVPAGGAAGGGGDAIEMDGRSHAV